MSPERNQQAAGRWQVAADRTLRAEGGGPPRCLLPAAGCRLAAVSCLLLAACCLLFLAACQQQMADQPRYKPLAQSSFFGDDRSARPLVEGTVARGHLNADEPFYTGKSGGALVDTLPFPITLEVLQRGRDRYNIFCSPCHDRTGGGQGMVVRRGYRQPASYHIDRLRQAPIGHFFDVITNGFGAMQDYAAQIPPADRWAIAAYIRALQLSQNATLADAPPAERQKLEGK